MTLRRNFRQWIPDVPEVERAELGELLRWVAGSDRNIILGAPRGYGVTKLLEEVDLKINDEENTSDSADSPWIFCSMDLAAHGVNSLVPVLVEARNKIIERIEHDGRNPTAEAQFILFDVVAALAWKRRSSPFPLGFYRTRNRKLVGAVRNAARALLLGELIEATGELTGLDSVLERTLDRLTEQLASRVLDDLTATASARLGEDVLAELRSRKVSVETLEQVLPMIFSGALEKIKRSFSSRLQEAIVPPFIIAVDSADHWAGGLLQDDQLRGAVAPMMEELAEKRIARFVVAGRTDFDELLVWQGDLSRLDWVEVNLNPFIRRSISETLSKLSHWSEPRATNLLDAVCERDSGSFLHPSALGRAIHYYDEFDPAVPNGVARRAILELDQPTFTVGDLACCRFFGHQVKLT